MALFGTRKRKRVFNPFSLHDDDNDDTKKRINFTRMPSSIKTKPMWWLLLAFVFVISIFWYLRSYT